MPNLLLVGPGRVGQTLGALAGRAGYELIAIVGQTLESVAAAAEFMQCPDAARTTTAELSPELIAKADLLLIATPDDAIGDVAESLAARGGRARAGAVVAHASGHVSSERLAPLRATGFTLGSLHPLRPFPDPARAAEQFAGTPCGLEGAPAAIEVLREFAAAIGGRPFTIPTAGKTLYHTAAVIACNYQLALAAIGVELYAKLGIGHDAALELLVPLMRATVEGLAANGLPNALTGPIDRGDAATVRHQLAALAEQAPEVLGVYRRLGRQTIELARAKGLDPARVADLRAAFDS